MALRCLTCWRGVEDSAMPPVPGAASVEKSLYFDLAQNKLIVNEASVAKDGPVTLQGNYSFAGLEDRYFAAAALPSNGSFQLRVYSDPVSRADGEKEEAYVGVAFGGMAEIVPAVCRSEGLRSPKKGRSEAGGDRRFRLVCLSR